MCWTSARRDRSWYYKDQDELDAWVEHGLVSAVVAAEGAATPRRRWR